ncbi:MAG: HTH domain-containing protein [Hungatella sp.]|nr:HTH domain-containing protein [Hungatella sp.]
MSDSRLFKMLYYLLDRERATAPELAAEFEVSTRTIYRNAVLSSDSPFVFKRNRISCL